MARLRRDTEARLVVGVGPLGRRGGTSLTEDEDRRSSLGPRRPPSPPCVPLCAAQAALRATHYSTTHSLIMADVPYDYSFIPTANHTNPPNSGLPHARSLSLHHYPPYQHVQEPTSHFDPFADPHRPAHNDPPFLPTLEFRVPLLSQAFHLPQEYQQRPRPALPSWVRTHYDDHFAGMQGKGTLSQPPVNPTHSVPLSVPVSLGLPLAFPLAVPVPLSLSRSSPIATDLPFLEYPSTSSQGDDIVLKTETPSPGLQDTGHAEILVKDSPAYPFPVVAKDYPDLFAATFSSLDEASASQDASFAAYAQLQFPMPSWSPDASSLPSLSLSYGSPSSSEHSYALSVQELPFDGSLRLSLSPPPFPARKVDEDNPRASPILGIIVDINMRERALAEQEPALCVNPADIMAGFIRSSGPSPETSPKVDDCDHDFGGITRCRSVLALGTTASGIIAKTSGTTAQQLSPVQDYTADFPDEAIVDQTFPEEAISAIVSVLKSSSAKPETSSPANVHPGSAVTPAAFATGCEVVAPRPVYAQPGHTYPGSDLGMLRPNLADASGGRGTTNLGNISGSRVSLGDIRAVQLQYTAPQYVPYPPPFPNSPTYAFPPPPVPQQVHAPVIDRPKPVLNAHVGIQLEELRQRAAEYRAQHPNAELDKAFLQSFAGRLSARGELLDDYRCYVVGCGQRNKRRDHILVHVGSHVEHRPWACQHWYVFGFRGSV